MDSSANGVPYQEIWVFGPGDYEECVGECGVCHPDQAEVQRHALAIWLLHSVWDDVLDPSLFTMPRTLREFGIDPAACRVMVMPAHLSGPCGAVAAMAGAV